MGALFLHLKPDEYLKKLYKTKKLVEKTSFSLQAEDRHLSILRLSRKSRQPLFFLKISILL
ncbi:hypothetical protein D9C10_17935 [Bacillus subtilis subsp. subtilis]|uniref:hypothetical protein n=1 Tax=Bacillus subtilis TaxID=1423 RepID=UPI000EF269E4|nr:hypothetical protein [Bacillus subtilis]AYK58884.1 hypothetical protein D9C10_17935 [Bacillus subtilis subsp. subtilis]